jgi:dTMP kinase
VPRAGRLITLEGLDGSGKTTLARGLVAAFPALVPLREPGGVVLAERIRALVTDPALTVDPRAEALLYAAARAQLVAETLRPLLDAGRDVLLDRFLDSSLAYQGAGRGLGVEAVRAVNHFGTAGLEPDLTLLLRIEPAAGRARQEGRAAADRLEQEPEPFFAAVAAAYDALAAAEPGRIVVLDAAATPDAVLAAARSAVAGLLAP